MPDQEKTIASEATVVTEATTSLSPIEEIILETTRKERTDSGKERAKASLQIFIDELLQGKTVSKDALRTVNTLIADIDKALSTQVNEVLHHPDVQKLEGSWRGLHHLVYHTEGGVDLKIRVMHATKKDLVRDFENATDYDQSAMFKKVYQEEFGVFGGHPIGCIIGDYEFDNHPEEMELLSKISNVAAAAHAPFISAATPNLFKLDSFEEINNPRDMAMTFDTVEYAKWQSFRESEDSRYVALVLPRVAARLPYGRKTKPVDAFNYEEDVDGTDHKKYLWMNAAYAFGTRITNSFRKHGWLASIRGVENGGLVEDLPIHVFNTGEGGVAMKCPTESVIWDTRDYELAKLGFIGLLHEKNTDRAAFFSGQTCQKAKKYDDDKANANARLSTSLPYILCVSRFAHYLKVMARDKIGSFMEASDAEKWLNRWIKKYTIEGEASNDMKAKYPLKEARIEVREKKGMPGCYEAVAYLRPHFQLEELTVSMRLVAELPEPKGG